MKSRFLLVLATAAGSTVCSAQNLIPNGSFEEVINCPEVLGALHTDCADWYGSVVFPDVPLNQSPSPDLYHSCSPQDLLSPPDIIFGNLPASDGNAYAGFISISVTQNNGREIIGVQLTENLEVNHNYILRFDLAHAYTNNFEFSSNNIGARFTTYEGYVDSEDVTTNFAHANVDSVVSEINTWRTYEFEFVADSMYEYLHIGNFFDDDNTTLIDSAEGVGEGAYYFIDNVVLQLESPVSINDNSKKQSEVSVFPNPVQDYFTIGSPEGITKYTLYNLSGDQIRSEEVSNSTSLKSDISLLPSGIYILQVTTQTNSYYERVVKI
jgi:hypothetical protein